MGNENTKEVDLAQPDGKIHEKGENGGVNGISLSITANGYTVDVPAKISMENNEEPPPQEVKTESTEYVVLESANEPPEAEALAQTPDPSVQKEEVPPREERVSLFSKMFKKKTTEEDKQEEDQPDKTPDRDQQLPNGKIHEKQGNGTMNGIPASDQIQVSPSEQSVQAESTEYVVLESQDVPSEAVAAVQTPSVRSEEVPPKEERVSLFSKMFKKKTAPATEKEKEKSTEEQTDSNLAKDTDHQRQNGDIHEEQRSGIINAELPSPEEAKTESTEYVVLESQSVPTEAEAPDPGSHAVEVPPREERVSLFSKMFKKKTAPATEKDKQEEKKPEEVNEDQTDAPPSATDQQLESGHLKAETETEKVVEGESRQEQTEEKEDEELDGGSGDITEESQDSPEEENPVMNFFKTLVTPTKTSKKEAPVADAPKDQPQPPENQPAPATTITTVAQVSDPPAAPKGMPAPPPPPPEPPRAEPAAKAKPEEPKAAAKDSPKGKSAKDTLTRFFRSKTKHKDAQPSVEEAQTEAAQQATPEEAPQPVTEDQTDSHTDKQETAEPQPLTEDQEKPDASKASTLEAAAKPAPAPATSQEEKKKPEAKKSLFSFLKPKALLDSVSATVQAASTSGVQLLRKTTAAATEPKAAAAPAAAAAEPGPAKEDVPKAAKSTEATAEAKLATAAPPGGEEVASPPKKLEKRNSITLFFKNLSQKRGSTDAGAQTEASPAPSAEKSK